MKRQPTLTTENLQSLYSRASASKQHFQLLQSLHLRKPSPYAAEALFFKPLSHRRIGALGGWPGRANSPPPEPAKSSQQHFHLGFRTGHPYAFIEFLIGKLQGFAGFYTVSWAFLAGLRALLRALSLRLILVFGRTSVVALGLGTLVRRTTTTTAATTTASTSAAGSGSGSASA